MAFTTPVSPIETQLRKVVPELCVNDVPERVAEVEMSNASPMRSACPMRDNEVNLFFCPRWTKLFQSMSSKCRALSDFFLRRLGMRCVRVKVMRVQVKLNILVKRKCQAHFQCERGNNMHKIARGQQAQSARHMHKIPWGDKHTSRQVGQAVAHSDQY